MNMSEVITRINVGQLDNTYILQPDGTKKKLERK